MTTLEIILTIIVYLIIGVWICYKRDFYDKYEEDNIPIIMFFATLCMPINLLIVFIKQFILNKWKS